VIACADGVRSLRLVGDDVQVPLVTGGTSRYVNLDYAASTPPLAAVATAVAEMLPWYSSVHRGAGFKSRISTIAYEAAREEVRRFLGGRTDDVVLFTRNTTDSLNLLEASLPSDVEVVAFAAEHHANMLPWRRRRVTYLPIPHRREDVTTRVEDELRKRRRSRVLVAITGASNVTGEFWPVREVVEVAHRYQARVVLDAAQLAPHAPVDIAAWDVDYVSVSGHKLYAPFGAGVLCGRPDWMEHGEPFLFGGGAVKVVTTDDVVWAELPDRQEAGSPNVVGAVALAVACGVLRSVGMDRLAGDEDELHRYAHERLDSVPGLVRYRVWDDSTGVGIVAFNVEGFEYSQTAAILSAEFGIGVRHGCFCAHPLMMRLLNVTSNEARALVDRFRDGSRPHLPGAVRISIGLGTTREDIDRVADALIEVATDGPRWAYARSSSGDFEPSPDPRPLPAFPLPLTTLETRAVGEAS